MHSPADGYLKQIDAAREITGLGDDLFGDSVNSYSGTAQFSVTDINLPGNSSLPVRLGRHLDPGSILRGNQQPAIPFALRLSAAIQLNSQLWSCPDEEACANIY